MFIAAGLGGTFDLSRDSSCLFKGAFLTGNDIREVCAANKKLNNTRLEKVGGFSGYFDVDLFSLVAAISTLA